MPKTKPTKKVVPKKKLKKVTKPVKKVKKLPEETPIATVIYHGVAEMTKEERKVLAEWLRREAKFLMKEGDTYSKTMKSNYYNNSLLLI